MSRVLREQAWRRAVAVNFFTLLLLVFLISTSLLGVVMAWLRVAAGPGPGNLLSAIVSLLAWASFFGGLRLLAPRLAPPARARWFPWAVLALSAATLAVDLFRPAFRWEADRYSLLLLLMMMGAAGYGCFLAVRLDSVPGPQVNEWERRDIKALIRESKRKGYQDQAPQEALFRETLGEAWLPVAGPLVRAIGGLKLSYYMGMEARIAAEGLPDRDRMEALVKHPCCPLGWTWYIGDGDGMVWIDAKERFYAQDGEGVIFLAGGVPDFFDVMFRSAKPQPVPEDLRDLLPGEHRWG